jgi:hypothetical protein
MLAYISNFGEMGERLPSPPAEADVNAFVIGRLAELVVVLFNDHVGRDPASLKDRAEARVVLLALGDVAADHGRPELTTTLHDLAAKIETGNQMHDVAPRFERQLCTRQITYRW